MICAQMQLLPFTICNSWSMMYMLQKQQDTVSTDPGKLPGKGRLVSLGAESQSDHKNTPSAKLS